MPSTYQSIPVWRIAVWQVSPSIPTHCSGFWSANLSPSLVCNLTYGRASRLGAAAGAPGERGDSDSRSHLGVARADQDGASPVGRVLYIALVGYALDEIIRGDLRLRRARSPSLRRTPSKLACLTALATLFSQPGTNRCLGAQKGCNDGSELHCTGQDGDWVRGRKE